MVFPDQNPRDRLAADIEKHLAGYIVTTVAGEDGEVWSICITHPEHDYPHIPYIELIATNPRQFEGRHVVGAATALIEDVVIQSLKKQGLSAENVTASALEKTAVTVQGESDVETYYEHLGFVGHRTPHSLSNFILSGDNLIDFLKRFAGRATP